MAIMSKEYYADIESVYKKPEDYELAGKGNAYGKSGSKSQLVRHEPDSRQKNRRPIYNNSQNKTGQCII